MLSMNFYHRQISQVIEIELRKWQKRAKDQHAIRFSWSPGGRLYSSSAWTLSLISASIFATIVVERLVEGYDVNYGARSVMNAVKTLAVQILAESQVRGDIGEKYIVCLIYPSIAHVYHANSWLTHLFINDAGDIDMAKEDPNGELHPFH